MRSTKTILPSFLLLALAAPAAWATDVPRGGTTIDIGPGSKNQVLTLKNTTGEKGCDLTLTVFGAGAPNIEEVDVLGAGSDTVDDDNDGALGGANENDTTDSSPDTTCRTIFNGFKVNNNGTISVTVQFSANLPATAKLKVRFSTEIAGKHWDLCAATDLSQLPLLTEVPIGTHLANFAVTNLEPFPVQEFHVMTPLEMPITDVVMLPPFDLANVQLGPDVAVVQLPQPIFPGETVQLNLGFAGAADPDSMILIRPGPAIPHAGIPYGQGCAGTDGAVPELHVAGLPVLGGPMTLWIGEGLGGSAALFFVGLQPAQLPIGGGCDLLLLPLVQSPLLPLSPGGAGDGNLVLPILMPPAPQGLQLHLQGIVADPGSGLGFSTTNGVTLTLP